MSIEASNEDKIVEIDNQGCPLCDKKLSGPALYGHLHKHGFKKGLHKFKCKKCQDEFTNLAGFWKHSRIHDGTNRPFECNICQRTFERQSQLKYHTERDHEGRRPYEVR